MGTSAEQWPAIDSFQLFRRYFTVDIHTQLVHLYWVTGIEYKWVTSRAGCRRWDLLCRSDSKWVLGTVCLGSAMWLAIDRCFLWRLQWIGHTGVLAILQDGIHQCCLKCQWSQFGRFGVLNNNAPCDKPSRAMQTVLLSGALAPYSHGNGGSWLPLEYWWWQEPLIIRWVKIRGSWLCSIHNKARFITLRASLVNITPFSTWNLHAWLFLKLTVLLNPNGSESI